MAATQVIHSLATVMGLSLRGNDDAGLTAEIAATINHLLVHDFNRLISLLYRMDVSETKLKQVLKEHPQEDAGKIIAVLLLERQAEKLKSRGQYNQRDNTIDEEEKW